MTAPALHIQKIDALRGIAILGVFLFHTQLELFPDQISHTYTHGRLALTGTGIAPVVLNFSPVAYGWTGVELFLLISGFLIHRGYLNQPESFQVSTFFSKRFWRIYPPYLLALLFFCIAGQGIGYYVTTKTGMLNLVSHLLMVQNLHKSTVYGINSSFWSLALEVQLYMVYPIFLLLRNRFGIKRILVLLIGLSISSTLVSQFKLVADPVDFVLINSIPTYWAVWAAGAYLAEAYHDRQSLNQRIVLVSMFVSFILLSGSSYFEATCYYWLQFAALFWSLVVVWFLNVRVKMRSIPMALLTFIGLISYSLYLIHQPFLNKLLRFFKGLPVSGFSLVSVSVVLLVLVLLSFVLYRLVELPAIQVGKRLRLVGSTTKG
ncbi:acyltransferase family protein [Spirosoma pulveris]